MKRAGFIITVLACLAVIFSAFSAKKSPVAGGEEYGICTSAIATDEGKEEQKTPEKSAERKGASMESAAKPSGAASAGAKEYIFAFPEGLFSEETTFETEETPFGFTERKYKYAGLTVAESFGLEPCDYLIDIDGDGYTELLCNVVFGGDGHRELFVYKADSDTVLLGTFSRTWLPDDWNNWGSNAAETWYDRDAGDILVRINSLDGGQEDIHFGPETLLFTEYVRYDGNSEGIYVF